MKYFVFSLATAFSLIFAPAVFAAGAETNCQPIYGGGQTCVQQGDVLVNKKVAHPQNGSFVDNLGINDPKYGPESVVNFQITVTNTGSGTISKINIKDIFPQYTTFNAGSGNYDRNTKILSVDIDNLQPNETRTLTLSAKVAGANELPNNQGVICVINQATGTANNKTSQDNSQFCIEKQAPQVTQPGETKGGVPAKTFPQETKGGQKVFPQQQVQQSPNTGPEALALFALLPAGALGHFLRKKTH
jgi:uncharacterized repeat protein (TIGR01451 family)